MFRLSKVRLILGLILISASVLISGMYGAFGQIGSIVFAVIGGNFLIAAFWQRDARRVKVVYRDRYASKKSKRGYYRR